MDYDELLKLNKTVTSLFNKFLSKNKISLDEYYILDYSHLLKTELSLRLYNTALAFYLTNSINDNYTKTNIVCNIYDKLDFNNLSPRPSTQHIKFYKANGLRISTATTNFDEVNLRIDHDELKDYPRWINRLKSSIHCAKLNTESY